VTALVVCMAAIGLIVATGSLSGSGESPDRTAPESQERRAAPTLPATPAREMPVPGPGRLAGYARDVNLNPVPGVRVHVAGAEFAARTDARGRYRLRLPRGEVTVVAEHPGHATQHVTLSGRPPGGRLDFSLAATRISAAGPDSAHRLILWTACRDVAALSEPALDRWIRRGVDGFVCSAGRLEAMGGEHAFNGDPRADLSSERYALQRALRSSAAVRKARSGELKLYLGVYASNAHNPQTAFEEWFDDEDWTAELLPAVRDVAAAARSLGFAGVAIDQELYPVSSGTEASWSWDYPGNERSEEEVRAQVAEQGRQLMGALLEGYPGLELAAYDTELPESWSEKVQEVVNGNLRAFEPDVRIDLWDGLSSVPGYSAIHWLDATFYKTPHLGSDWATGLQYNANRIYSLLSRRLSNWSYASSRLHLSPFSWINEGPSEFAAAQDPESVAEQLTAFTRWGTGGTSAIYNYGPLGKFDYKPYRQALRRASTPTTVTTSPPRLTIDPPSAAREPNLSGTATSDFAIRAVRWHDDRGRFGTAELDWDVEGGDIRNGWRWTMRWRLRGVRAPSGRTRITVVAEDIKGLASERTLTVTP
jgi:hypothetical protein